MAKEVKNYIKDVNEITAPISFKSAPDSPEAMLAYVTKPEIDLLVKANLHGSMNGMPNRGPRGIMSLDGGGSYADETGGKGVTIDRPTATREQQKDFATRVAESGGTSAFERSNQSTEQEKKQFQKIRDEGPQPDDDDDETKKEDAVGFIEGLFNNLRGPNLTRPITREELALYQALQGNFEDGRVKKGFLKQFVESLGAFGSFVNPITRYTGTMKGDFFRDDDKGFNIQKLNELEDAILGEESSDAPFYGEFVDGGVNVNLPGSLTREGRTKFIDDILGKEFEGRLERQMPDVFYPDNPMPATTSGLVDLASKTGARKVVGEDGKISYLTTDGRTISKEEGEAFNDMIFAARAELNRQNRNPFTGTKDSPADSPAFTRGGGSGGGGESGGGGGTPPSDPTFPVQQPGQPFFPFPSTGIASIFDPAFMGPSFDPRMAEYTRRGLGDRSFDQFYRNLERFPVV